MKFQFDGTQAYQLRAIESVAVFFQGRAIFPGPRVGLDGTWRAPAILAKKDARRAYTSTLGGERVMKNRRRNRTSA